MGGISLIEHTMKAFVISALVAVAAARPDVSSHAIISHGHGPVVSHAVHAPHHGAVVHHAAPLVHHAAPLVHHAAPLVHHAPVVPHHPAPYHEEPPKDYTFGFEVNDYDAYGNPNHHARTETREGPVVKGQYRVELPDCRTQIVDYFVDEYKQYHAD